MKYKIAMIPYTNMAPYRELGEPENCECIPCIPSKSILLLQKKEIIAAAVPVGGLPVLKGIVQPVGKFGIAVKEKSLSVLFFSDRPFTQIDSKCKVYLTDESATSVRLLYLLFGYKNGFDNTPRKAKDIQSANGQLIIGDNALIKAKKLNNCNNTEYKYVTDLAVLWYNLFKLPFVFARWVIIKDIPGKIHDAIKNKLYEFRDNERELVNMSIPKAAFKLRFSHQETAEYFKVIKRVLDDQDIKAQEFFLKEIKKHDLI